ncbi:MAG: hypothetical protein JXB07_14720 [Anaerolineae bacterium]|nr:hypothetical protein [Anaerolineae bacterium]
MSEERQEKRRPLYGYILSIIVIAAVLLAQVPGVLATLERQAYLAQYVNYVGIEDGLIYSRAVDRPNIATPTLLALLLFLCGVAVALYRKQGAWLWILGIVAQILLYGLGLLSGPLVFGSFSHIDSVDYDQRTFNLAYKNNNENGFCYYLFECVGTDAPCHKIAAFGPNTDSKVLARYFDEGKSAQLYLDAESNTLSVQLEGEILYTYALTQQ